MLYAKHINSDAAASEKITFFACALLCFKNIVIVEVVWCKVKNVETTCEKLGQYSDGH